MSTWFFGTAAVGSSITKNVLLCVLLENDLETDTANCQSEESFRMFVPDWNALLWITGEKKTKIHANGWIWLQNER